MNWSTKSFRLQVLSLQILFRILSDTWLMMYLLFHDRRTLESSLSLTQIVQVYCSCQAHTWFQVGRLTEHGSMRRSCRSYSPVNSSHQLVQNTLRMSEKLTDVYCKSRSMNRFVVMSPGRILNRCPSVQAITCHIAWTVGRNCTVMLTNGRKAIQNIGVRIASAFSFCDSTWTSTTWIWSHFLP